MLSTFFFFALNKWSKKQFSRSLSISASHEQSKKELWQITSVRRRKIIRSTRRIQLFARIRSKINVMGLVVDLFAETADFSVRHRPRRFYRVTLEKTRHGCSSTCPPRNQGKQWPLLALNLLSSRRVTLLLKLRPRGQHFFLLSSLAAAFPFVSFFLSLALSRKRFCWSFPVVLAVELHWLFFFVNISRNFYSAVLTLRANKSLRIIFSENSRD